MNERTIREGDRIDPRFCVCPGNLPKALSAYNKLWFWSSEEGVKNFPVPRGVVLFFGGGGGGSIRHNTTLPCLERWRGIFCLQAGGWSPSPYDSIDSIYISLSQASDNMDVKWPCISHTMQNENFQGPEAVPSFNIQTGRGEKPASSVYIKLLFWIYFFPSQKKKSYVIF